MKKKIFLSYVKEDEAYLSTIINWKSQDKNLAFEFNADKLVLNDNEERKIKTRREIEELLGGLIDDSNAIIMLIGNDTHSKMWIEWEYNYAQNKKLKIGLMRIPGSTGGIPRLVPDITIHKLRLKDLRYITNGWGW